MSTTPQLFSAESEKIVLAMGLIPERSQVMHGLLNTIAYDDFFQKEHQDLWSCIRTLHDANQPADMAAIMDFSRSKGIFVGGVEYLISLTEDPLAIAASDVSVLACSKRIKDLSTLRRTHALMLRAAGLCEQSNTNVDLVLSQIEDDIHNLRKISGSSSTGPVHVKTTIAQVLDQFMNQLDGKVELAASTGFSDLDKLIAGLEDEAFIIVAARPSMGKTAFINNLALNGSQLARPQLIFSLEMKKEALVKRMLAREGNLDMGVLRSADLSEHQFSQLNDGIAKLENYPIWIDDTSGLTIHEIRARARTFVQQHGKATIYVDYIQFVAKSGNKEDKAHVDEVSRSLKNLARELKCPVVGLSQLNRALEQRANKRPIMSDLRESGSLEQDADVILFLYRDVVYNPDTQNPEEAEVIVAKQRDGAIGTAKLGFTGRTNTFYTLGYE